MPAYNYFGVFRCAEASAQFLLQKLEYKTLNLLHSVVQNYFRNLNRLLFTQAAGETPALPEAFASPTIQVEKVSRPQKQYRSEKKNFYVTLNTMRNEPSL